MAEKIELEVALKDLGGYAKDANLNETQKGSYAKHLNQAEVALNTKDWKNFQKHFNAMVNILKDAVGASKDVSQALKTAIAIRNTLAKEVNALKSRKADIESTVTKTGKLKITKAQSLYKEHGRYSSVKDDSGKQIADYNKVAENVAKITVSAKNVTNEIAKAAGFADKASAQAGMAIIKSIEKVRQEAVEDAPKIEAELAQKEQEEVEASQEVDRLTLSASKSAESIIKLYEAIDQLGIKTNNVVTDIRNEEKVRSSGSETVQDFGDAVKPIDKQSSSLGKAFKQFTLYAIAIRTAKKALNEAKKTIIDLDKYLTEQAMVTGKTRKETYELLKEYQNLAKELGTTSKEVAEVATQYMRQGKTAEDAITLTKAAVSAAKVAGISATESVTYLTTALNGFQLSANDAMLVSDKFASIAAQSASSYEELAIALSKVASQANLAGMSIDYTTALLAKGLETTREAPETIGTALKTVIARMREMGDYGETLEGDTDVNNVETQLAYVNIALKNQNGELRSTEEVLDELGKKWSQLTVNQQAAVAKALAGTRQQSRLIAMMQDYERVTELQEISQRSAGATMAQMETYLQGMDAALNKLNTAWEQIVTNLTDSDAIVNLINLATGFLDELASFLSTDFGVVATLTTISLLGVSILNNKVQEMTTAKAQKAYEQEALKIKLKARSEELKILITEKERTLEARKRGIQEKANKKIQALSAEEAYKADLIQAEANSEMAAADAEIASLKAEQVSVDGQLVDLGTTQATQITNIASGMSIIAGGLMSVVSGSQAWLVATTAIGIALKTIPPIIKLITALNEIRAKKAQANAAKEGALHATNAAGKIISQLGVYGIPIAIAVAAALGAALAISGAVANTKETTKDQINALSASIYNLQKTLSTLETIESKFDDIDNKVIKTNKDLKEMKELLSSASDVMSSETGDTDETVSALMESQGWTERKSRRVLARAKRRQEKGKKLGRKESIAIEEYESKWNGYTEKEYYDNLATDADKRRHLEEKEAETRKKLEEAREQQLQKIKKEIEDGIEAEKYKSEITALTNAKIYEQIDALKNLSEEQKKATETIIQSLTDEMSAKDQLEYLNNPEKLQGLINKVGSVSVQTSNGSNSASEVMTSDSYSLTEKVQAYKAILSTLSEAERNAFIQVYKEFDGFVQLADKSSGKVLEYVDKFGVTADKINDLQADLKSFGDNAYLGVIDSLTKNTDLETGIVDLQQVIKENFKNLAQDSEEYKKVLLALEKAIGETTLNIGQNMTKTQNQINNIYETATKWSTMSAADQASFLSENAKLFKDNPELYEAFRTGDYAKIEQALKGSDALREDIAQQIRTINSQLAIEEARAQKYRDEALIQYLKDQRDALENEQEFYKASLDIRLDQEKKQLDIYKNYLQKQKEALIKSLEDRKDAYSKYFEAVNQEYEDEEYEEQANLLATNLSKLATSDNAASKQQTKELEKQLQELENERLKELRQRAQEAVLENLDDQVEEINKKFDKLLENNQNLLAAMLVDENNKDDFIANMVSSNIAGMTANEAQKWMTEDFMTTFGSLLPKEALAEIEKTVNDVINLNVEGNNVQLSAQQQNQLREAIMKALQQIGYN